MSLLRFILYCFFLLKLQFINIFVGYVSLALSSATSTQGVVQADVLYMATLNLR